MRKDFFRKSPTVMMVMSGLLLAMNIVLSRFLSIQTPVVKIGFAFVPLALAALLYGPISSAIIAGLGDFLGAILFPVGPYFPGFTITAFLAGLVYGCFLYNRTVSWSRVILAVLVVKIGLNLAVDTIWLYMMMDKAYFAILVPRIAQCALLIPVQTLVIYFMGNRLALTKKAIAA